MSFKMNVLATVATSLLLSGSLAFAKPMNPLDPAELALRNAELQHAPWNGKSASSNPVRSGGCIKSSVTIEVWDPITNQGWKQVLDVRRPNVKTTSPVVIIVPTIEGSYPLLEPKIGDDFCNNKIASIIADVNDPRQPAELPAWGYEDVNNRRATLALRTAIDWAETNPGFDSKNIGMMGLSLGGITTAMMVGVDSRIKAAVIVVGGGNMPFTLTHSVEGRIATLRDNRMRAAGITDRGVYEDKLRETIKYDPVYFAPQADKMSIYMVMANTDDKVPYVTQQEVFKAFGGPQSLTFNGGHVDTIVQFSYFYLDRAVAFYRKRFAPPRLGPSSTTGGDHGEEAVTHEVIDLDAMGL